MLKLISIISPCYNEEENVEELYERVCSVIDKISDYSFEYIFIDNASTDGTVQALKKIAALDSRVKIIINTRNFGHIRSPYWGILQTKGDATIYLASDLQDPPEMIPKFIEGWERGYKVVMAVKPVSEGNSIMHYIRRAYYRTLDSISNVPITRDTTGFGLYDKCVVDNLRQINDPYPYLRGLVDELGHSILTIDFVQPRRLRGLTKNNFYTLYDIAMLGIVSHSLVPLRLATFFGFLMGAGSLFAAVFALVTKIFYWNESEEIISLVVILLFFIFGVVLLFIGLLGEYIGSIHAYVKNRPIVVEKERINF